MSISENKDKTFGPNALATPANAITTVRILASPFIVALIINYKVSWITFSLWAIVSVTDGADGYVARRMGATNSGAFLDPLADKIAVLGAMFALAFVGKFSWIPVGIIAFREVLMSLYRSNAGKKGVSVPASKTGKAKTFTQDLAVALAVFPPLKSMGYIAEIFLWVACLLTVISGIQYWYQARSK
jgi:CDP-diacylglycerol--glycerol-3-phosphate 3-phosphatidyltransferase